MKFLFKEKEHQQLIEKICKENVLPFKNFTQSDMVKLNYILIELLQSDFANKGLLINTISELNEIRSQVNLYEPNVRELSDKNYRLINKDTIISSAGSCFAAEIAKFFQQYNYNYLITEDHIQEE